MSLIVKPNASQNLVQWDGSELTVCTTANPENGKANAAVLKLLKKQLGVTAEIISGFKSSQKRVQIIRVANRNK